MAPANRDTVEVLLRRLLSALRTSQGWLNGWQEIAKYMSVSAHTAKEWERKYCMPIRRGPSTRVKAIPFELDRWLVAFDDLLRKEWDRLQRREENGSRQDAQNHWRGGKHDSEGGNLRGARPPWYGGGVLGKALEEIMRGEKDKEPMD